MIQKKKVKLTAKEGTNIRPSGQAARENSLEAQESALTTCHGKVHFILSTQTHAYEMIEKTFQKNVPKRQIMDSDITTIIFMTIFINSMTLRQTAVE